MRPILDDEKKKIREKIIMHDKGNLKEELTLFEQYIRAEDKYHLCRKENDDYNARYWEGRRYSYWKIIDTLEKQLHYI